MYQKCLVTQVFDSSVGDHSNHGDYGGFLLNSSKVGQYQTIQFPNELHLFDIIEKPYDVAGRDKNLLWSQ